MQYQQQALSQYHANTGYTALFTALESWGVTLYSGVTGGGVIHFLKYLPPYQADSDKPKLSTFFTLGEYSAGFLPLGYFLATGKIAAAVATTGAATKLLLCGLSDAKLHDIPAVYIVPVCAHSSENSAPLQDTYASGSNIISQLQAECPQGVFVLDNPDNFPVQLQQAQMQLANAKPVILALSHDALNQIISQPFTPSNPIITYSSEHELKHFTKTFLHTITGKKVTLLVGEEMARYSHARQLVTELSTELSAAVIWSINGANAVDRNNPYGYGYISFGGNDKALAHYQQLGENDVLLVLGCCPDEYTVNLQPFTAGDTFFCSAITDPYAAVNNNFQHLASHNYHQINYPLDKLLTVLSKNIKNHGYNNIATDTSPAELNNRQLPQPRPDYIDLISFYQRLDKLWPQNAIGFDDVCLAYKDRQYITQRPNNHIRFYSLYRGSAMGGAFGAAIGAKLASTDSPVFLFTGDGCFRLFAGSLGEASALGLVVFVFNNASFSIVEQGLAQIIPEVEQANWHAIVKPLDYCTIAKACGWQAVKLKPDLSNLEQIFATPHTTSLLIDVPVDPEQIIGVNPRVRNL